MIYRRKIIVLALTLLISSMGILNISCTKKAPADSYEWAINQSRHVIDTLRTAQKVPGMQIAVWHKGEMVFSEGFGFADLEQMVPLKTNTKMRIGSVSKTLTSAAVGKLVEQNKLDLDAPVQQYVSYFPRKEYEISTRQVAGHIAGIRHYRGQEFLMDKRFGSVKESLQIFADDTLLFKPGTDYSYSSYGWNLVSAVVEEAAGQPFLTYMKEKVFAPLDMDQTVAEYPDSLIYHRTSYYSRTEEGTLLNAPDVDNSYKWAGGGFIGTAEDLVTFGREIFWGDYLKAETLDMLTTSLRLSSGEKTGYGIGWQVGEDSEGRRYYGHSGGSVGGTTQFVVFPEQELVLGVISNMGGVSYRNSHLKIADFFMDVSSTD